MMEELYYEIRPELIYSAIVISLALLLIYGTKYFYKWLNNKLGAKFPHEDTSKINLTKKILYALWVVLAIIALTFIFIDREQYSIAKNTFNKALYLGIVAVAMLLVVTAVQVWFSKKIYEKSQTQEDTTSFKFIRYVAISGVYVIGVLLMLMTFESMRGFVVTALGSAGVIAIVAGVASQEALSNLVGGLFIIVFKPFKVNDIIKIDETMIGTVTDITLRHTVIKNYQNRMIVIPNAIINKEKLINFDLNGSICCEWIVIGISYDSDIDLAKSIIQEECENHPLILDNRSHIEKVNKEDVVKVRVVSLDDSSISIKAWAWARNYSDGFVMKCDLLESIKKRFDREGIEIPFPHRTLIMKKEEESLA
ncbi:mechanosensitive ion channel family protein [Weeksellaceae bacterium KMM 9713]|uniref:Mechanosensitive ion channel family protein n=1 Tax=Profundicola chukchiensis TaxID=2961959 RepID=A0A9X4MYT4_9FLAO|nr:mechanosensitive ion channel family protein [Profundicola chukchiensis]MDG4946638.1 mechanosensitive ion channel family protein [Profundicola chukchiensis]